MDELWANIVGYEGRYQISTEGNVRSIDRNFICKGKNQYKNFISNRNYKGKIIKPILDKKGYLYVCLCKNNIKEVRMIHRLVAQTFINNSEKKLQVNHKNGIKTDNRVENLEWVTAKENIEHAYNNNLFKNQLKHLKKVQKENKKRILQYDLKGNFIREWESISIAKRILKISAHIGCCCSGKRKTAGGFIWKYKESK